MHNGDGVCFYYDDELKLCTIYENRPLMCNVIDGYQLFKQALSLQQYFDLNYQSCQQLKKEN
jgi:Fe-S-cluster containining protein